MAAFNKFNQFVQDLAQGKHNLNTDTVKVMLTNTAPSASNTVKANITDIAAGNGYTAGGSAVSGQSATQTSGTLSFVCADTVFTAAGGSIGPFRYAVYYNDTQTSPAKPLIGYYDYGSSITLNDTDTFTVDVGTNLFTIA